MATSFLYIALSLLSAFQLEIIIMTTISLTIFIKLLSNTLSVKCQKNVEKDQSQISGAQNENLDFSIQCS